MTTVVAPPVLEEPPGAPPRTPTRRPGEGDPLRRHVRTLWWLTVGLIAVGVAGRLLRYFLQFPIYGDEARLSIAFLERDYTGLLRTLQGFQVAPVLFLWSQLTVVRLLGPSEWAMRLGPLLAGLSALFLFWRLARITLHPLPALLAVGLLAVARWPVTLSVSAKPYSFDLLMALLLVVPAAEWLRRPQRLVWPALLVLAVPLALLGSYPAVFVAGAVSLALLPTAWRARWEGKALFVAYNLLMVGAFLAAYAVVGRAQEDSVTGSVRNFMLQYWAHGFPPTSPLRFLGWFALINSGRMMAYPIGGSDGESVVTLVLFLVGAWAWWKAGRRALLVLALTPFALNFLAAVLQRYPYGGCGRLSQHLAPAVCLLVGMGLAVVLETFVRTDGCRFRWTVLLSGLLALCGGVGMACDVVWPYKEADSGWKRDVARRLIGEANQGNEVVVEQDVTGVDNVVRWYLEAEGKQVRWNGDVAWDQLAGGGRRLCFVTFWIQENGGAAPGPPLPEAPALHGWTLVGREDLKYPSRKSSDPAIHARLYQWSRPEDAEPMRGDAWKQQAQ